MTLGEIKNGESKNIEFKVQLPDDSKKYILVPTYGWLEPADQKMRQF